MEDNGGNPTPPKFTGRTAPSHTAMTGGTGNKAGSKGKSGSPKSSSPKSSSPKQEKEKDYSLTKKDAKSMDDELDRYHLIRAQIDDQTRRLDKLSEAKDRAFGKKKVQAMNAEIAAQ